MTAAPTSKAAAALAQPNFRELYDRHDKAAADQLAAERVKLDALVQARSIANLDLLLATGSKDEAAAKQKYVDATKAVSDCDAEIHRIEEARVSLKTSFDHQVAQENARVNATRLRNYDRKWEKFADEGDEFERKAEDLCKSYEKLLDMWSDLQASAPGVIPISQISWGGMASPSFRDGAIATALYRACHDVIQKHGLQGPLYVLPQPKYDTINNMGYPKGIRSLHEKLADMRQTIMNHLRGIKLMDGPAPQLVTESALGPAADILAEVDAVDGAVS